MTHDAPEYSSSPTRILVVDDHELVRKGIRALLYEVPGFEVVGEARNGQEAVSCARELEPDVILMDLRMPVMDGIEATRQITAARRASAVLVLTGTGADDDVLQAIRAGAAGYLLKDSSAAELVRGSAAWHEARPPLILRWRGGCCWKSVVDTSGNRSTRRLPGARQWSSSVLQWGWAIAPSGDASTSVKGRCGRT